MKRILVSFLLLAMCLVCSHSSYGADKIPIDNVFLQETQSINQKVVINDVNITAINTVVGVQFIIKDTTSYIEAKANLFNQPKDVGWQGLQAKDTYKEKNKAAANLLKRNKSCNEQLSSTPPLIQNS